MDEHAQLREQFADDPWLSEVVESLTNQDMPNICTRRQARHWAMNFTINDGKLWYTRTKATDRATRVECVPKTKRVELAAKTHEENGHFGWDHTRLKLRDKWFWQGMDRDSKMAITECSCCRNFGPRHINSLLRQIGRAHV